MHLDEHNSDTTTTSFRVYRNSDITAAYVTEIVADKLSAIDETNSEYNTKNAVSTNFTPGSTCLVLENSSVWMLGNDKKWHEI